MTCRAWGGDGVRWKRVWFTRATGRVFAGWKVLDLNGGSRCRNLHVQRNTGPKHTHAHTRCV